jgi:hypothetical protein
MQDTIGSRQCRVPRASVLKKKKKKEDPGASVGNKETS